MENTNIQNFEVKITKKYSEYWESDIGTTPIETDTLEFIYQNGAGYLNATINSMKNVSDRALVLLSYLLIVIGFLATHIIKTIIENGFTYWVYAGILFTFYYMIISWDIVKHMKPRKAYIPHREPAKMLQTKIIETGLHNIKLIRCVELQNDIMVNRYLMNKMYEKFESAIACTFIFPFVFKLIRKAICSSC